MKKIIHSFLLALLLAAAPVWAGSFAGEKIVSTNADIGSQFPEVAYFGSTVHVVFVGYAPGLGGDIYYSRSTNNGSTFSTPVNLSNTATGSTGNDRPQVAALSATHVVVGWNSSNDNGAVYIRRSSDGGVNFVASQLIAGAEGDAFYTRITDLFRDSAGNLHVSYYTNADNNGAAGMVRHRMSCDNGVTWGGDTAVTSQTVEGDFDNEQPRLGEAGGRIFMAFRSSRHGNPQGGWAPYSMQVTTGTVGGCAVAWRYPSRRLAGGIPFSFSSTYRPEIFGDSNGNLHLAWWDNTAGANILYRKGTAGAPTFGPPVQMSNFGVDHLEFGGLISTTSQAQGGFQVPPGLVSNGTTAFMTYQRHSATTGGFEMGPIYIRESGDNGVVWGAEQAISTTNQAATPRIALGGTGDQNVGIVWTDLRSGTARVYFRLYTLGAVSGGPSFALSPDTFNFGSHAVGSTPTTTLTLVNTGTTGTIQGIASSGDFTVVGGTCSAGGSVGAGGSCTLTVRFAPSALSARTGSVTVSTDAVDSPAVTQLSGAGVGGSNFNANASAVVTGYYETILGRAPDAGGVAFWNGEANRVISLGADVREAFFALSIQFFRSAEYVNKNTTNAQFLTDLYRTFFDRAPDQAGFDYWTNNVNSGMDRGAVLGSFLFSLEFSNKMTGLFGSSSPRPEVNVTIDLYRGILGRLPDSAGFNFWLGRIRAAQCQGTVAVTNEVLGLAEQFINSPEYGQIFTSRPPSQQVAMYLGDLYNAFLRRGPDLAGYQFYVNQINTGGKTLAAVRTEFVNSPEFQARANAVIAAGCLP